MSVKRRDAGPWRLLGLALVLHGACADRVVPQSELVGTWSVANDSRELLASQLRSRSIGLILRHDGTFEALDVPGDLLLQGREWEGQPISGSGTWSPDRTFGDQRIALSFQALSRPDVIRLPFRAALWASRTKYGPQLYYYRGDPDERFTIAFEKVAR